MSSVFPNVFARVSGVIDWIDANVCQYSRNPPADFNCHERTSPPTPTPAPSSGNARFIPITIQLVFISEASYTWWFILNDIGELVFIHPRYGYSANATYDQHVVALPVGNNYTFVTKNEAYNNLGRMARFAVRLGSHGNGESLVYSLGGSFDLEERVNFTISDSLTVAPASPFADTFPPSESPTIHPTMTPTTTNRPTVAAPSTAPSKSFTPTVSAAPTIQKQDVTIIVHFKGYPSEIGYKIMDSSNKTILDSPFGSFGVSNLTVQQVLSLPTRQSYTFVIKDYFGDGVWPGSYSLLLGPPGFKGPKLIAGTGVKGFEERHSFYVPSPDASFESSVQNVKAMTSR